MSSKPRNINISPIPKERRPFPFFRSRTLSSSSTGSNEGGVNVANGSTTNVAATSPRLSTRSILDKVRKRSNSDAKASTVDQINGKLFDSN